MKPWQTVLTVFCFTAFSMLLAQQQTAVSEGKDLPRMLLWAAAKPEDVRQFFTTNQSLLGRGDGCSLNVYWFDEQTGISSAQHGIALFVVAPEEESFAQLLRDTNSGLEIRVGVRYEPMELEPSPPGMSRL